MTTQSKPSAAIKRQAKAFTSAFYTVFRGSPLAIQIYRTPKLDGYSIVVSDYGNNIMPNGAPVITISDLSLGHIPDVMEAIAHNTNTTQYVTIHKRAKPNTAPYYSIETRYSSVKRRVSAALAEMLLNTAFRDDALTVSNSQRTDEVSFCEFCEWYTLSTIKDVK